MTRFVTAGAVLVLTFGVVVLADEKALKELAGSYKCVGLVKNGKESPADVRDGVSVKIAGDELTVTVMGNAFPAKIKIDPDKKPATIDIMPSDGAEKGKTFPGIYKLEKGELTLVFAEKGDRPTEFKGEGDVLLMTLKKEAAKDK